MNKIYPHIKDGFYCIEHKLFFKGQVCPKCEPPPISYGNSKNVSGEVSKNFTNNLLTNTKKSRRVYVKRIVSERFHSYRVKFNAVVDWGALFKFPEVKLRNNVSYKRLDFPEAIVRVFRKSILVTLRANQDIKGLPVREAKLLADSIVGKVLAQLPSSVSVSDSKVSSLHNAFMNHPTAKHNVVVKVDGEKRLISDNSHNVSEFEAVSPTFAVSDSEILESWNKDLITSPFDLPSVTKRKIDLILSVQERYASNIDKHLKVLDEMSVTLKDIRESFAQKGQGLSPLLVNSNSIFSPDPENVGEEFVSTKTPNISSVCMDSSLTISKFDDLRTIKLKKVAYYKKVYGW